eukprot:scaffold6560_cov60-Phaeocystis_antarctica.AAC.3
MVHGQRGQRASWQRLLRQLRALEVPVVMARRSARADLPQAKARKVATETRALLGGPLEGSSTAHFISLLVSVVPWHDHAHRERPPATKVA